MLLRYTAIALLVWVAAACSSARRTAASERAVDSRAAMVIDVRTPQEFASGHVRGAINVPVDQVQSRIKEVAKSKDTPLMVHCQSGGRSARAAAALREMGYTNVKDLGSYANAQAAVEGRN